MKVETMENSLRLFDYSSHPVRAAIIDGEPWFVARDVCDALAISWRGNTLDQISDEWKTMRKFRTVTGSKETVCISEPAVYKLAFRSSKPEAEAFVDWVVSEVLPQIRKTGRYELPTPTPPQQRDLPWTSFDIIDAKNLEKTLKSAFKMKAITRDEYQVAVRGVLHCAGIIEHLELPFINDPWAPSVAAAFDGEWITTSDALLIVGAERTRANEMRMARVLTVDLGLKKIRRMINHIRVGMYVRAEVDA